MPFAPYEPTRRIVAHSSAASPSSAGSRTSGGARERGVRRPRVGARDRRPQARQLRVLEVVKRYGVELG
jgi:hypothetical protein